VLGGGAPVYNKPYTEPAYFQELKKFDINTISRPTDLKAVAKKIIQLPNIASKRWVYEQYDSMVGLANTSINEKSDAAVVRIDGTDTCLALTVDCNSRFVYADPYVGAMIAVSEAARNITCSGGMPSAITNCLNFGNPNKPEVYWTFVEALRGMGDACIKFDTPVTGGNVSFYNQSNDGGAVFPTPTIGMIGTMKHIDHKMTLHFKNEGDLIYILGETKNDINSSQYLVNIHKNENSSVPYFNLEEEYKLQSTLHKINEQKLAQSMHDVSEGGLFVTLLESAMSGAKGFEICYGTEIREDAMLFGESQSRVVVSIDSKNKENFEKLLTAHQLYFSLIGKVTKDSIQIKSENWGAVSEWATLYNTAIEKEIFA
jgi:phosphoribosylformylglycinamidine synthase